MSESWRESFPLCRGWDQQALWALSDRLEAIDRAAQVVDDAFHPEVRKTLNQALTMDQELALAHLQEACDKIRTCLP